jgi:hypothetical protein
VTAALLATIAATWARLSTTAPLTGAVMLGWSLTALAP